MRISRNPPEEHYDANGNVVRFPQSAQQQNTLRPQQPAPEPFRKLDMAALASKPVPTRTWLVHEWVPVKGVTINFGDGGTGKTLLSMMLMASAATEADWCGMPVKHCKSIGLFSEDDTDELHIRFDAIARNLGVSLSDLTDITAIDAVGQDNILIRFNKGGIAEAAPRFKLFREEALDLGMGLAVIDTAATSFGGNENDRAQVTQYVGNMLAGLARDMNGSVILNAHPSVAGMISGSMTSGSTGWGNSGRMRWALEIPKAEKDGPPADPNARRLTKRKANGTSIGQCIDLRWSDGVFVLPGRGGVRGAFEAVSRQLQAEAAFLAALAKSAGPVSQIKNSGNYGPRLLRNTPDGAEFTVTELTQAMNTLLRSGRIASTSYGPPSKVATKLVVVSPDGELIDTPTPDLPGPEC